MKIFIICSKKFYDRIPEIQEKMETLGHALTMPNSYEDPAAEERHRALGAEKHGQWKASMIEKSRGIIKENDAVLVVNLDKGEAKNYIGGATFLEMYDAFKLGKKIFLFNQIPEGILHDEIVGFNPTVLEGDLTGIL